MAGLVAAARLRELGAEVCLLEKGDRPGGSMLLSSGVLGRYRDFDEFRRQCPGGDPELQRLIWERLDDALDWLERFQGSVAYRDNPLTIGRRFDPARLTAALAVPFEPSNSLLLSPPAIVATGGYSVRLAKERGLLMRSNPWSEGDGIDLVLERGGEAAPSD